MQGPRTYSSSSGRPEAIDGGSANDRTTPSQAPRPAPIPASGGLLAFRTGPEKEKCHGHRSRETISPHRASTCPVRPRPGAFGCVSSAISWRSIRLAAACGSFRPSTTTMLRDLGLDRGAVGGRGPLRAVRASIRHRAIWTGPMANERALVRLTRGDELEHASRVGADLSSGPPAGTRVSKPDRSPKRSCSSRREHRHGPGRS